MQCWPDISIKIIYVTMPTHFLLDKDKKTSKQMMTHDYHNTKKKCKVVIVGSTNLAPMMRREMVRAKWEGVADKALVIAIEYPLFPLTKP